MRFDIGLLAKRLLHATAWIAQHPQFEDVKTGYFGASTGAAAALVGTAQPEAGIRAVVSRGGRPDLAGPSLAKVQAPTLLIVGGEDSAVLGMNREAYSRLSCEKRLEIIPGATIFLKNRERLKKQPGSPGNGSSAISVGAKRKFSPHSRKLPSYP